MNTSGWKYTISKCTLSFQIIKCIIVLKHVLRSIMGEVPVQLWVLHLSNTNKRINLCLEIFLYKYWMNLTSLFNTIGIQMNTDVQQNIVVCLDTVTVYWCYLLTVSVYPTDPFHFNCHTCTMDWYMQFTGSWRNASAEFLAECIVSVFP